MQATTSFGTVVFLVLSLLVVSHDNSSKLIWFSFCNLSVPAAATFLLSEFSVLQFPLSLSPSLSPLSDFQRQVQAVADLGPVWFVLGKS